MALKRYLGVMLTLIILSAVIPLEAILTNWTNNDPYPLFSSVYPYDFLSTWQKAHLMRFEYAYPVRRFRISASGFRQFADRGRNNRRETVYLGDLPNGRWNMLGLFYDEPLRNTLFNALNIANTFSCSPAPPPDSTNCNCETLISTTCDCFNLITQPRRVDPNKEFGFFSIPMLYRKYGVRFDNELLLIDRCFDAVGLQVQFGIADVRQTVLAFNDLTCQALGIACPYVNAPTQGICTDVVPPPAVQPAVATPNFVPPLSVPPCPANTLCAAGPGECLPLPQRFTPCCSGLCCFSFNCDCKRLVIEKIMKQKDIIAEILGLDLCDYHKVGVEDLRIELYWRHIFVINQEAIEYPRWLFMPFVKIGTGIPMDKAKPTYKPFAVPVGNGGHTFVGVTGGFTLNFLDTIDLSFQAGFTHFFKHRYCNYRLRTDIHESGIFPYKADIFLHPGTNWHVGIGMNAYRFLDNLSSWIEYVIVSHAQDKIEVCKSFIPTTSRYYPQGFLVEQAECLSKWESHMLNIGFNYDLSPHISAGVLFQAPVKQRNAYRSGMVLGTLTFIY